MRGGKLHVRLSAMMVIIAAAQTRADQTINIVANSDSFVRELDPSSNFGGAGNLCVAGANSVNGLGNLRGRFDSAIKFSTAAAVGAFNASFGAGGWTITSLQLQVYQVAAPENTFFPRGGGQFSIAWLSSDNWSEGMGTPNSPQPGSGNIITWTLLQSLVTGGVEHGMGVFTIAQADGAQTFSLGVDSWFLGDFAAGGDVTLHVLPQTDMLGFTFHSRDFSDPTEQPLLSVTAAAILYGDLNCDGVANTSDVGPFVLALVDPSGYAAAFPNCSVIRADMNRDGIIDGRDVQGFAAAMIGP